MVAECSAFRDGSLQSCHYTIEGVTGNTVVSMFGTADLWVEDNEGVSYILRMANSLMNPGTHTLLSLAHLQCRPEVEVFLTNSFPRLVHTHLISGTVTIIPLTLDHGTFVLPFRCLDATDLRRLQASVLEVTPVEPYTPPTTYYADGQPR